MVKKALIFLVIVIAGLAFFKWHKQPRGVQNNVSNESKSVSATHSLDSVGEVVFHGSRDSRKLALTFDADMTPRMLNELKSGKVTSWYNKDVVEVLEENKVPATLFLSGMWAENYPKETKELAANPLFELGNHSYSHPSFNGTCYGLNTVSDSQDDEEIEKTQEVIRKLTGEAPKFFRFPGGCFSEMDVKIVEKHNLTVVQWDVVSGDAFEKDSRKIVSRVLKNVQNGSIVVFHMHGGPNAPATAQALPEIISKLKEKGFSFVKTSKVE